MKYWLYLQKIQRYTLGYLAVHLEYRFELFFWLLGQLWPLFWMALWREAAARDALLGEPGAYTRYFVYAWLAASLNTAWSANLLSTAIRQGYLSYQLLRPFPPVLEALSEHFGAILAQLPLMAPLLLAAFLLLPELRSPPPLFPYLALVVGYFAFEFTLGWLIGILAFWFEKSENLYAPYAALRVFFGGLALPLTALPAGLRSLLLYTPLPYAAYAPGALAAGWPVTVGRGMGVLFLWTLALGLLAAGLWRRGLRRYGAVGG